VPASSWLPFGAAEATDQPQWMSITLAYPRPPLRALPRPAGCGWRSSCLLQQHRKPPRANAQGPPGCGWGPLWWGCVRRCPTLPHPGGCSTIGAGGLSFRVRDGSGRFPSAMAAVTCVELFGCGVPVLRELHSGCVWFVVSPRPISTGQLHTLRCFHFRPINPVVWLGALTHEGWETSSWNELPA
jgi:hypothetical protein